MEETIKAIVLLIAGWALGIVSTVLNDWLQTKRERRKTEIEREKEIRNRLVGNNLQTSEVMLYIKTERDRKHKDDPPDLSRADLSYVDLRKKNLEGVKLYRANLDHADLNRTIFTKADLIKHP